MVEREDAVVYSRDFGKDPIWVSSAEQTCFQAPTTSSSAISTHSNPTLMPSRVCSSSDDLRAQNVVDKFFQPIKVTCRLLGVILEKNNPKELQKQATVKFSVLDVLLEITNIYDLYLMERVIDDEVK
ncbi:hypothetical protein REPUB_Repub16aG0031700 [Reevesia pubescens]